MLKRRTVRGPSAQTSKRGVRVTLEQLEDRCLPHSGITTFTAGITPGAAPTGIVNGPDGNFWFTEFDGSRIARITPTGTVTEFPLASGRGPLNIAVGPDHKLWFTENTSDRIGRIDALAGSDGAIQASIVEFAVPGAGSAPGDITAGPDGALWFTETGSDEIARITTAGVITNEFAVPGPGSTPSGIATGPDGALWFTEAGSGQIGRISTAGVVTEFVVPVPAGNNISDPEDIVAGPAGALYFTDFARDQIGRITTAGVITQFNLPFGRGPLGIVAHPDGDLYFTEAASSRIGRLPASALAPGRPTSGTPPLEEFDFIARTSTPVGITLTANDDIWFTLNAQNAIGSFLAHLEQITAVATGPTVQVYDIHLNQVRSFTPFPHFKGPLSVAVNDVNGNGVPDIIVSGASGGPRRVKVFDGSDNRLLASFFAFDPAFKGGVTLASDDVNGDGRADIIVAAGAGGGSHIKVIDSFKLNQVQADGRIADGALLADFFAFKPSFKGSVTVATGDLNRDGKNEIIVGAGPGVAPQVKVIDATKLGQLEANGRIAASALLANFFAFDRGFRGGIFVAASVNTAGGRDLVIGAGPGMGPQVRVIDGTKLLQVEADHQIADSAVLASFFAFGPSFHGGVRVAADDLNSDGQADVIVGIGPGDGPHVKVVDGTLLGQVQANGRIADSALLANFFSGDLGVMSGVAVAADADHRDGPIFGPPGITITNSRVDVNDMFIFQSPANANNSVMIMDVNPFATATTPAAFVSDAAYEFRIANRDLLHTTDDLTFRMTFGPPDANANGQQDVEVRALPAARFPGVGGVLVKGFTGQNIAVRGVGGSGAMFRAAEQDDPFFFDAGGFTNLLNFPTAVDGVVAGAFPRGTSPNGFGPGSTPNFDAPNFFGPSVNTMSIILEIPSARLTAPGNDAIGFWGRTERNGVQLDRMGRPAINTALIPPVPRGTNFPIGGTADQNRQDRRSAFNAGHPRDDRAIFGADMVSVLTAFYPAGRPGGNPSAAQAGVVANLLLPDILVFRPASSAGFAGDLATVGGTTFLAGGRKLSDDIISTELAVLTDDDLPAALGGGPNPPAIVTQNVRDDNGLNLTNGSLNPPPPQGTGAPGTGTVRAILFPYIGARNPNPTAVPGTPPPP